VPARVVAQQRKLCRVAGEAGEMWAEVSGRLRYEAADAGALPAVGDWVAIIARPGERATVHAVLPRRTKFSRQAAGKGTAEQVVAANVDTVLLLSSLNQDLNPRRMERFLAQVWESGASPVVVLTKCDADTAEAAVVEEMERVAAGVPLHRVSGVTGNGVAELRGHFRPGRTVALLGSSGVGKSTLVNYLLGRNAQRVREIREGDGRGRHATTARELFVLPDGGLVLDTPGLRELQLWDAGSGLGQAFADIAELATQCRFRDCGHQAEPGCAVQAALASGELDAARWESLRKLERERQFQVRKVDAGARAEEQKRWKQLHKQQRDNYRQRRIEGRDKR
jgi:ribosome biogenesis GTPase